MASTTLSAAGAGYHAGKILARRVASPTVVVLDIQVAPTLTSFQPGQWVDFCVPPYTWIGGFSPASVPSELPRLTLAVKKSDHAPSAWVHSSESCEIGRPVQVQVGGSSVLDKTKIHQQPVVFCAGGIGISPLLSMYREWTEIQRQWEEKSSSSSEESDDTKDTEHCPTTLPKASFLYSISRQEELVFKEELVRQASLTTKARHHVILTLTQQATWDDALKNSLQAQGGGNSIIECRIGRYMKEYLESADRSSSFYLCGPPRMLDEGIEILERRGVEKENVHYERWW